MNNKKRVLFLIIIIMVLVVAVSLSAFAYFSQNEFKDGKVNVDYTTKGVDLLTFDKKDFELVVNDSNFSKTNGSNLYGETSFVGTLETTNASAKYCYNAVVILPDEKVFSYSKPGVPELILDVSNSSDGKNYTKLISDMDITTKTGTINIPTTLNGTDYKFEISSTKNKKANLYFKADVKLVWFNDADQSNNANKTYSLILKANIIEC